MAEYEEKGSNSVNAGLNNGYLKRSLKPLSCESGVVLLLSLGQSKLLNKANRLTINI